MDACKTHFYLHTNAFVLLIDTVLCVGVLCALSMENALCAAAPMLINYHLSFSYSTLNDIIPALSADCVFA
jgi:hypothetical protein